MKLMRLKSDKVLEYLRNQGFEDTCTGGGCYGWYFKRGDLTYYITTMVELTLPTKSRQHISIGVYDSDFEKQYISYNIKNYIPSKTMLYVNMLEKRMKSKAIKAELDKHPDKIVYLPRR